MSTLTNLAKELANLKADKTKLEAQVKSLNKQIIAIAVGKLPELMQDLDISKFVVDNVGTFYLQDRLEVSVLAEDRKDVYLWCKREGHGDLVVEYIWPKTLNAWAKEQLTEGQPLPDKMKATFIPTAMLRRSSK